MRNLRNTLKSSGYDSEEAYFYAREQELIQKMRASQGRTGPKLEIIQGGKQEETVQKPQGLQNKKAA